MATTQLATAADLSARGITGDYATLSALLDAATDAVRAEAGTIISRETSTVTFPTEASRRIELPARPVHAVTSVLLDGEAITDWHLRGTSLWRESPWQRRGAIPSELTVTFEHGWDLAPAAVVDIVCALVAGGLAAVAEGYDPKRRMSYERIDDYQYGLRTGDDEITSVMELPRRTTDLLRRRFGIGSAVVGSAR